MESLDDTMDRVHKNVNESKATVGSNLSDWPADQERQWNTLTYPRIILQ